MNRIHGRIQGGSNGVPTHRPKSLWAGESGPERTEANVSSYFAEPEDIRGHKDWPIEQDMVSCLLHGAFGEDEVTTLKFLVLPFFDVAAYKRARKRACLSDWVGILIFMCFVCIIWSRIF